MSWFTREEHHDGDILRLTLGMGIRANWLRRLLITALLPFMLALSLTIWFLVSMDRLRWYLGTLLQSYRVRWREPRVAPTQKDWSTFQRYCTQDTLLGHAERMTGKDPTLGMPYAGSSGPRTWHGPKWPEGFNPNNLPRFTGTNYPPGNVYREIDSLPIYWDVGGLTHLVEGAYVHEGVGLLWTLCHVDVPAGTAYLGTPNGAICVHCTHQRDNPEGV